MRVGSILLGQAADRLAGAGYCWLFGADDSGNVGAALAPHFLFLGAVRLLTGIEIGGMLPCLAAIVAETSNRRWRAPAADEISACRTEAAGFSRRCAARRGSPTSAASCASARPIFTARVGPTNHGSVQVGELP